jgi:hypothetical protein
MERSARRRHGRRGSRAGAIVAATWLIGLGLVFLVRDGTGWSWGEAWPMFLILVGVASGVSEISRGRRRPTNPWTMTGPVVLTGIGVLFLLATTGSLGIGIGDLIARWWPVGLLIVGAWFLLGAFWPSAASQEHLTLPLSGSSASIRVRFGAGELRIGRSPAGTLVDGEFTGGVVHRLRAGGELELEPDSARGWAWLDRPLDWRLGLSGEVPLDLRLDTGAARGEIDLGDLQVRSFRLQTGASQTLVRLPRAAGTTRVSAEAGAAEVRFEVPAGVAASIRSRVALGSTQVDQRRFPRTQDRYESPDYATASNRVEIDLQGGVGTFRVESA